MVRHQHLQLGWWRVTRTCDETAVVLLLFPDVAKADIIWGDFAMRSCSENAEELPPPSSYLAALQQNDCQRMHADNCGTEWDDGSSAYPYGAHQPPSPERDG
jgi:hypothetical protein